jgi:hypothetical protein
MQARDPLRAMSSAQILTTRIFMQLCDGDPPGMEK